MISPALEKLVEAVAAEVKSGLTPEELAHVSDFRIKAAALDAIRAHGNAVAEEMVEVAHAIELAKAAIALARLLP